MTQKQRDSLPKKPELLKKHIKNRISTILAELEEDFDVDEVEDLARLAARLEADPAGCPRTREALTRAGIG